MTPLPQNRCPNCFQAGAAPGNDAAHGGASCDRCGWRPGDRSANPLFLAPGTVLGESYVIGQVLGHGGLGVTYLAWDASLETRIAIKEFLPDNMAGRNPATDQVTVHTGFESDFSHGLARFRQEGKILARFEQHPGIVSVKQLFSANGTGYMVMEFVAGVTLRQYLEERGGKIPWPRARSLLAPVMDTLAQVHEAGLLHRDITPANLYLAHDGQIKLLDFGAARESAGDRSVTLSVVVKPGYAPWEQYQERARYGPWTDVYALCATLYRAITGQLPPTAPDRVYEDHLQPPSALKVTIPEKHEAVLMKGLAIRQENRWQSMSQLRTAWEKADRPVPVSESVPPEPAPPEPPAPPPPDKYAKYTLWFTAFAAVVTAIGVVFTVLMSIGGPKDPPDPTGGGKPTPGGSRLSAPDASSPAIPSDARPQPPTSKGVAGVERSESPVDERGEPLVDEQSEPPVVGGRSGIPKGEPTSGGSRLSAPRGDVGATGRSPLPSTTTPVGAIHESPLPTPPEPAPPPTTGQLTVRSNVTGDTVTIDGNPVGPTGPEAHELPAGEYTVRVEKEGYEPFEEQVTLAAGDERTIHARLRQEPNALVGAIHESPLPESNAIVGARRAVPLPEPTAPDYANWRVLRRIKAHPGGYEGAICWPDCIAFAPDGRTLLTGSWDNTLKLWDVASGKAIRPFKGHSGRVQSVAFSPDGRTALSGSYDDTLRLWDVASGKEIRVLKGHSHWVWSVAFAPDGRTAFSGSYDNTLRLWNVASGKVLRTFRGHSDKVWSVAFASDGRTALSGSNDRTLRLWDVAGGKVLRVFTGHAGLVRSVAFAPDGRTVLSGSNDGTLRLWGVASGEAIRTFKGNADWVYSVAFAPDGRAALSGSSDKTLRLWDVASGEEIRVLDEHSSSVRSVAFSPDGRRAASGDAGGTLILWGEE